MVTAADVAGWGNSDLLYVTGDATLSVSRMAAPAAIADAIVTIRNGEGRVDTLAYSPMTLPAIRAWLRRREAGTSISARK